MAKTVKVPVKIEVENLDAPEIAEEEALVADAATSVPAEEPAPVETEQSVEVAELAATRQELASYKDKYLRAMADIENLRKAWERRSDERVNDERKRLLRAILPLIDNFERAIDYAQEDERIKSGLELSYQEVLRILAREGVEPIIAKGEHFDPNLHDAVAIVPAPGAEPGTIIEQMERGFLYKGELLRPACVMVAEE